MPSAPRSSIDAAVAELCPACGLCCNGVLFADVELQPNDRVRSLKCLGLAVRPKGRSGKRCFGQPCPAFQDSLCSIYSNRPTQCRAFECGQIKRLATGEITATVALNTIRRARAMVDRTKELLRQNGNEEENRPLTARYRRVMAQPIDLARGGDRAADLRGQLMLGMRDLMHMLHREFLH